MWSRHSYPILFFSADFLILGLVYKLINNYIFHQPLHAAILFFSAFLFFWIMTSKTQSLIFDYYTHVFMAIFWALLFCVAYLISSKEFLLSLDFATSLILALFIFINYRFIFTRLKRPMIKILSYHQPIASFQENDNVEFYTKENIGGLKLNKYDCLLYENNFDYPEEWRKLLAHAQIIGVPIITASYLEEYLSGKISVNELHSSWIDNSFLINPSYAYFKRALDLLGALLLLPFLIILIPCISILILIFMGKPIFFTQNRLGQDGKIFKLYKFRTMSNSNNQTQETSDDDNRITQLGDILRRLRIDEIPQILNVIKNEMSFIGPRPEREDLAKRYDKEVNIYNIRHIVKPGITGWAQVMLGYTCGSEGAYKKLQYDLFYVKHFSLWLDLKILFKTFYIVLGRIGAR